MPANLPPIPVRDWETHLEGQHQETVQRQDREIASLGALEQEDQQRQQAREQAWQARTQQEDAAIAAHAQVEQQAAAQPEQDFQQRVAREDADLARYAQREQQGFGTAAPSGATTGATRATTGPSVTTSSRTHSPGVEANRASVEAAFGDLGPGVVENMLAIQDRESGGNPAAQKTDAVEDSHGPFQVNARAHPDLAAKYDLHDPAQNARAAREVYDAQGYAAWLNASRQLGLVDDNGAPTSPGGRGSPSTVPTADSSVLGSPPTPAQESRDFGGARGPNRAEAVGQFEQGLPYEEAAAICGPVAALAFAQANGRNPSLAEVTALAKRRGWTSTGGMNGIANEQSTLSDIGVKSRLDTDPDFGEIAHDAASGNPVIISTGVHYYYANAYDPRTGRLFVGKTGTSRRGGGSWMTAQQIADLDGGINGVLYVDNPRSPTPSVAAADTGGDRPPSEFEQPAPYQPENDRPPSEFEPPSRYAAGAGASVGGSFADEQAGASVGGSFAEEQDARIPRRPPNPDAGLVERGLAAGGDFLLDRLEEASARQETQARAAGDLLDAYRRGEEPDPDLRRRAWEGPAEFAMGVSGGGPEAVGRAVRAVGGRAVAEAASVAPPSSTVFARFWNRARNVIEAQGDAGKELGTKLRAWRDSAETLAGEWTAGMPTVRSLTDAEFRQFVAAAEGKIPADRLTSVPSRIQRAVEEWDGVRTDAYTRAKEAGLDIGHLEGYFPHMFENGTFRGKGWSDAIDHLVQSGQAATRAEAAQTLRYVADVRRNRRYGNLEAERELDLPFYRRDKGVLFGQGGYLESAANRIAQVAHFGEKDADALALVDRIGQEGYDAGAAKALYDVSVGAKRYDPDVQRISGAVRGANTVTSLGLSAITNTGQIANTAAVAGFGPTTKNLWRSLRSPEAKEAAIRAGVTLDNVVQDVREGTGLASRALGRITAPGFGTVERFNRTLAFHAGVSFAEDMAAQAARGDRGARTALERLGLDADEVVRRGVLSDAEKTAAGRSIVERTQFKVDPQDLPQWAAHPVGKVFAQFKTFSYNQSAFLAREILEPAIKERNLAPLTRFMLAGLAAGAATTETRNVIQAREPEQDPTKRIIQYYQAAGGLGLVGDVLRVTSPVVNINADRLDPDRVVTQAVGTVLGPTVGTGIEALTGVAQATRGNLTPGLRSGMRRIPVVGTTLQNLLVPYKPRTPVSTAPAGRSSTAPPAPPRPPSPPRPPRPGGR